MKFQPHQLKKALGKHLPQAYKMVDNPQSIETLLLQTKKTIANMEDFNEYTIALQEDAKLLIEMIQIHESARFVFEKDVLAHFIGALLYYIAKTDMIFDVIPYIGYADDAAVVDYVLKQYREAIEKYRTWKACDLQIA